MASLLTNKNLTRLLLAVSISSICVGCVRRRLTVRTNPPGASVYVDKQLIGTTPASSAFTFYGTREIEVVADGFRTEKVLRKISPPWYQLPPLDFFAETLWPWEVRDERIIDVTLVPEEPLAPDVLLARADNLRLQSAQGIVTLTPDPYQPIRVPENVPYDPSQGVPPLDGLGFDPPPPQTSGPVWVPGQILGNFIRPGGEAPVSIPETGILQGGGYRPEM